MRILIVGAADTTRTRDHDHDESILVSSPEETRAPDAECAGEWTFLTHLLAPDERRRRRRIPVAAMGIAF